MATSIRSARVREIADGLRSLASMLDGQSEHVGRVVTAATTHVGTVRGVWAGPRADTTLTAGDAYLTAVAPASGAFASVGDIVRRLATTADDIAGSMEPHERTITDMDWYRFAGIEPDEALSDRYDAAGPALESLEADWLRAEATATAQLETDLRMLTGEYDEVLVARHRHQEPLMEPQMPVLPGDGPFWQFRLEWPIEFNLWPDDPEAGREPEMHTSSPDGVPDEEDEDDDEDDDE